MPETIKEKQDEIRSQKVIPQHHDEEDKLPFGGHVGAPKKVKQSCQIPSLVSQYLSAHVRPEFSVDCYHSATGIPLPRLIQHNVDYSDSLCFCSDTCSWVC